MITDSIEIYKKKLIFYCFTVKTSHPANSCKGGRDEARRASKKHLLKNCEVQGGICKYMILILLLWNRLNFRNHRDIKHDTLQKLTLATLSYNQ